MSTSTSQDTAEPKSSVEFSIDANGLKIATLKNISGYSAKVHLYGGQVTSWKTEYGEELLFLSNKSAFKPPKAIRGGVQVCFPQFSNLGFTEKHGFARSRFWEIDKDPPSLPAASNDKSVLDLILKPSQEDLKSWNHCFEYRLRIVLGLDGELGLISRIRNTDQKPFSFAIALNSYLSVSDINEVRIEGLETLDYLDNLQNQKRITEQGDALTFEAEVDKVYLNTPTKIAIIDHELKRTFVLKKVGFPDAVVWNPWERARAIPDLGDDEYKHMICVAAAGVEKPITLKPGEEWQGRLKLVCVFSSYHSGRLDPVKIHKYLP